MPNPNPYIKKKAFTLVEIIIVIAVIGILAAVVAPNAFKVIEKSRAAKVIEDARGMRGATEAYFSEMTFLPPETCRGDDPGFMRPLPFNPDTGGDANCVDATGLPPNWQDLAQERWNGPYLEKWPFYTPWMGKYKYDHWPNGTNVYGVDIPPGCYMSVQPDYNDKFPIPPGAEQILVDKGFDVDGHINGESILLLKSL
jgi:prepilin-type N-terminal cleavage/methylation domain-containing protein